MSGKQVPCSSLAILVTVSCALVLFAEAAQPVKRSNESHNGHPGSIHNHMSRKVFDRACAASKDTIDEIISCITNNESMTKIVNPEMAASCYKQTYGQDFDHKDFSKHKDMICKERQKFEEMTTCIYKKTTESLGEKENDKLAEAMVDVGLCILNALDG